MRPGGGGGDDRSGGDEAPAPAARRQAAPPVAEMPLEDEAFEELDGPDPDAEAADWDEPEPGSYDLTELDGEPIPQLPIQTRARVQRKKAQKRSGRSIGWYALLAAIVAVVAVLYFARGTLVELWPPIERLYVTAGIDLPAPPITLDFRDTATSFEDQDTTLVVSGTVINSGEAEQAVPAVEVVLLDSTGAALVTRAVKADAAMLPPGGTAAFAARFENYPQTVADLRLSFALPAR